MTPARGPELSLDVLFQEKQAASFEANCWSGAGTPTKRVVHRGPKSHVESTESNNMESCSKNVVPEGVVQPESPLGQEQLEGG